MNRFWKVIDAPLELLCLGLLYFYRIFISPLKPKVCKFKPTCSAYSILAIKRFGSFKGCFLTFKRLMRCNHKSKGGLDLVPDSIYELKFLV